MRQFVSNDVMTVRFIASCQTGLEHHAATFASSRMKLRHQHRSPLARLELIQRNAKVRVVEILKNRIRQSAEDVIEPRLQGSKIPKRIQHGRHVARQDHNEIRRGIELRNTGKFHLAIILIRLIDPRRCCFLDRSTVTILPERRWTDTAGFKNVQTVTPQPVSQNRLR